MTKNLPANAGNTRGVGLDPGWEDPLELQKATHSSILAWKIPWTEEPCRLQSTESQRVGYNEHTRLGMQERKTSPSLVGLKLSTTYCLHFPLSTSCLSCYDKEPPFSGRLQDP